MMQYSSCYQYPRYGYRSRYSRNDERERARRQQHIREYEELVRELGGSVEDVRQYFFSLPSEQLRDVYYEYGKKFGSLAREYAEETFYKWRDGRRRMSGRVARRLFNLLPPRMPLPKKYELMENLWRHTGPSSHKIFRIGPGAEAEDVIQDIRCHIERVVTDYNIPENLKHRFEWLSAGDVGVKQQLLNHVQQMEKDLVVEDAEKRIPVMLEHFRSGGGEYTQRLTQEFEIGKHTLEILMERPAAEAKPEEPPPTTRRETASPQPLPAAAVRVKLQEPWAVDFSSPIYLRPSSAASRVKPEEPSAASAGISAADSSGTVDDWDLVLFGIGALSLILLLLAAL